MTDIVEIARSRRSRLVAEIARLDDFISTAETLIRLETDPAGSRGWLIDNEAADPPPAASRQEAADAAEAEDGRENVKATGDGADAAGETAGADPGALDPASLESGGERGRNLFARTFGDAEDPVSDADGSAEAPEDEAGLDEAGLEEAGLDAAIGQKLRQRRWMMGMTKRQLAEKLGIDVAEIQDFELGLAQIGASRMWELAEALDVPTSYFFEEAAQSPSGADETRVERTLATVPAPARAVALARTA